MYVIYLKFNIQLHIVEWTISYCPVSDVRWAQNHSHFSSDRKLDAKMGFCTFSDERLEWDCTSIVASSSGVVSLEPLMACIDEDQSLLFELKSPIPSHKSLDKYMSEKRSMSITTQSTAHIKCLSVSNLQKGKYYI